MIGDRIKEARLALGYSAEQVAAFLEVSPATVYRYENGDISKLPSKFIKPLAEYLCITPEYLMGWTDEKPNIDAQPLTPEARILARGVDRLSPEERRQLLDMARVMFRDIFDKEEDHDA